MATHDMSEISDEVRAAVAAQWPDVLSADGELDVSGPMVSADQHVAFASFLKELGYTLYVSVIATHFPFEKPKKARGATEEPEPIPEHFEVATVLRNPATGGSPHFWWRVRLEPGQEIPTLVPLFAGADWQEREQFDLVGVLFTGHPDMRRLMLSEDWEGHPLRKDYAIDTRHAPWR